MASRLPAPSHTNTPRPARAATIVQGLLVFALLTLGLATFRGAILLLALPLLLYLSWGAINGPRRPKLSLSRALSNDRVEAGDETDVTVTIRNQGEAIEWVHVIEHVPPGLEVVRGATSWLVSLPAGEHRTFEYTVTGPRGAYIFKRLSVYAGDWFGILQRRSIYRVRNELFSYLIPKASPSREVVIRPRRTRVYAGSIPARLGGPGVDFFGVRDYQPGDSPRRVNWKASARSNDALYSNEFEQDRVADVGLILDARALTNVRSDEDSLFEYSIEATATLAETFISQGNRVALLIYGDSIDYTLPGYGRMQREKIFHSLARASIGHSQVFEALTFLPTRLFPPKSQIVFVTPLLEQDVPFLTRLRAFQYEILTVVPDSVAFEESQMAPSADVAFAARLARLERRMILQQLQQAGISIVEWNIADPFHEIISTHLRAAAQRRILGV